MPPPPGHGHTHSALLDARSHDLVGHSKKVHSVAWNCTGRKLASGSVDRTVRVWDINHGKGDKAEAELKGHTGTEARSRGGAPSPPHPGAQTAWTSAAGTPPSKTS